MSANTTCYVLVGRMVTEIIEVSALTLKDAEEQALNMPNVLWVFDKAYDKEDLKSEEI